MPDMEQAAHALVENPAIGTLLVADSGSDLVGVLAMSWQVAIHVPGRYGLIQDLWVDPQRRGDGIGAGLIVALAKIALANGAGRLEVGLPSERFAGLVATESFYEGSGFKAVGKRMRMDLP
jgi:GNAT superfamily N-acetyltransferase